MLRVATVADRIKWQEPYTSVKNVDLKDASIEWFAGGKLNVAENCVDRHLAERGNDVRGRKILPSIFHPAYPISQVQVEGTPSVPVCACRRLPLRRRSRGRNQRCG